MSDTRLAAIARHLEPGEKLAHHAEGVLAAVGHDLWVVVGLPLGFVVVMSMLAISGVDLGPPQTEAAIMIGFFLCCGMLIYAVRRRFVLALTNARVLVIALARFGGDGSRVLAAFPLDKTIGIQLNTMRRAPVVTVTGANKPFSGIVYSPEAAAAVSAMIDELRRQ